MLTLDFLLTSLLVVAVPGTGAIYTITTGLAQRWKASLVAAAGCTLGIIPHIVASILGLSALLNMSAQVFTVMKTVGALFLLYLAWKMWRSSGSLVISDKPSEMKPLQIAGKAIAINLLNPKLTLFFFAFLPLFVSTGSVSPTRQMITLSLVFMLMTFVVFALYGVLASAIRSWLLKTSNAVKRLQQAFAVLFAAFAVKLALSEK
jgi:threonine/homoserine/homoserine lactone efflux protein